MQRTWAALEELAEKDGIDYEYVPIEPYLKGPNGEDTKNPLPLEEKRRRYPGFVEASPRSVLKTFSPFYEKITLKSGMKSFCVARTYQ